MGGVAMSDDLRGSHELFDQRGREARLAAAEADRAAREAGYKPHFRRLLGRLRPHRREPGGDPQSNYGTSDGPGH
jgi:hypothetical protein